MVYDLEIEKTHNFVGNGIVAHNTTGKALGYSTRLVIRISWWLSLGHHENGATNAGNGIGTTSPQLWMSMEQHCF